MFSSLEVVRDFIVPSFLHFLSFLTGVRTGPTRERRIMGQGSKADIVGNSSGKGIAFAGDVMGRGSAEYRPFRIKDSVLWLIIK